MGIGWEELGGRGWWFWGWCDTADLLQLTGATTKPAGRGMLPLHRAHIQCAARQSSPVGRCFALAVDIDPWAVL